MTLLLLNLHIATKKLSFWCFSQTSKDDIPMTSFEKETNKRF